LGGALLAVVMIAATAGFVVCGKTGASRHEQAIYPSLEGTVCDVIAKAPPAHPRGPLPSDPALAAWTEQIESVLEEALALEAIGEAYDRWSPPPDREMACARKLWTAIAGKLPSESRVRHDAEAILEQLLRADSGSAERTKLAMAVESPPDASASPLSSSAASTAPFRWLVAGQRADRECHSAAKYLSAFPDNARLRRVLVRQFEPCLYDNFSSADGDLDKTEIFMRETVESWPDRAGPDFELVVAADWTSQDPSRRTWAWLRTPFSRITLDLGLTGNALRVVRDLKKRRPEIAKQLLPVAKKRAALGTPSNRKARWTALVAYLEADAPDPGEPPEPALAKALEGDERSARWALGYLPNELQEHAPRPFPWIRDPAVIKATVARSGLVTTDEDRVLLLDALSQMPPGTALVMMARSTSSPNESVWRAAMAAMDKQLDQLPIKAEPGELEAGEERRKHAATLLGPHLDLLRTALAPRICSHPEALTFLADANDKLIDGAIALCIEGKAQPSTDFLTTLFHSCMDHPDLGWVRSGTALSKTARPDEEGAYARRVAAGCATGVDR
jgi:hypothetical protein